MATAQDLAKNYLVEKVKHDQVTQELTDMVDKADTLDKRASEQITVLTNAENLLKETLQKEIAERKQNVADLTKLLEEGKVEEAYNTLFPQVTPIQLTDKKKSPKKREKAPLTLKTETVPAEAKTTASKEVLSTITFGEVLYGYTFEQSLDRLEEHFDFMRHPRPAELLAALEEFLTCEYRFLSKYRDLYNSIDRKEQPPVWVSAAVRLSESGESLTCGFEPYGITRKVLRLPFSERYKSESKVEAFSRTWYFDLKKTISHFTGKKVFFEALKTGIPTNLLPSELSKLLCGEGTSNLPINIQTKLALPRLNRDWEPLAFKISANAQGKDFLFYTPETTYAASLGVKHSYGRGN